MLIVSGGAARSRLGSRGYAKGSAQLTSVRVRSPHASPHSEGSRPNACSICMRYALILMHTCAGCARVTGASRCEAHQRLRLAHGDGDGAGDACDACPSDNPDDTDSDGMCDSVDVCPTVFDPAQSN